MKYYVIIMGEDFYKAKEAHGDNYFKTVQDAMDWGKLMLSPGQKFWICDENGGVVRICHTPRLGGNA